MFEVWRKCAEKVDPNLRWLASYLLPYKRYIAISIIFMIAAGLASSLIAKLLGSLTDIGFYKQESWIILAAPIGLIFISVLHGGSMFMSNYLLGKLVKKFYENCVRKSFTAFCAGLHQPTKLTVLGRSAQSLYLKRILHFRVLQSLSSFWLGILFR
jgi:ABC-type multidrug transport system fused ATPase/permease subunit